MLLELDFNAVFAVYSLIQHSDISDILFSGTVRCKLMPFYSIPPSVSLQRCGHVCTWALYIWQCHMCCFKLQLLCKLITISFLIFDSVSKRCQPAWLSHRHEITLFTRRCLQASDTALHGSFSVRHTTADRISSSDETIDGGRFLTRFCFYDACIPLSLNAGTRTTFIAFTMSTHLWGCILWP